MTLRAPRWLIRTGAMVGAVILACVATGAAGFMQDTPPRVSALFIDSSPLVKGNSVKASGVIVGTIEKITLQDGKSMVEMKLDKPVALHQDAKAIIRPISLLGERYVDLVGGSDSAPLLPDGAVIPPERTSRAVDLDQVLNVVDNPTATALAAMVTTLGEGMAGQGPKVADAIKALSPALTQTKQLGVILNGQNEVLKQLLDNIQPVASSLARDDGKSLDHAVGSTDAALSAIVSDRRALDETLKQLPGTLSNAQQTLGELAGVANSGTPVLASVRPLTNNLTDISHELTDLSDAADPALASAQPVLDRADKLLNEAAPVVADLHSAGPDLRGVASAARPLVLGLNSRLVDVLDFVRDWAMSTNGHDGLSHYFRGVVVDTPAALMQIPGLPSQTGPQAPDLPGVAPVPGGSHDPRGSGQHSPQDLLLPQLGKPTGSQGKAHANAGKSSDGEKGGSATGLTPDQENSMLGQLLGGS